MIDFILEIYYTMSQLEENEKINNNKKKEKNTKKNIKEKLNLNNIKIND